MKIIKEIKLFSKKTSGILEYHLHATGTLLFVNGTPSYLKYYLAGKIELCFYMVLHTDTYSCTSLRIPQKLTYSNKNTGP